MPRRFPSVSWLLVAAGLGAWIALVAEEQRRLPAGPTVGDGNERAAFVPDDGAGRDAGRPADIPAHGWWMILKRTIRQADEDRLLTEAASVAFFAMLALFPAIGALISLYGMVADRATVAGHFDQLASVVPGGGMRLIEEQVKRVTDQPQAALGIGAAIALLVSLWSANQATKALFDALNVVYEEREKRGFVALTATTLAFTLGGLAFMTVAMAGVVVLPVVLGYLGFGSSTETLLRVARWPLMLALVTLILAALYRFGPSRQQARWRWVTWGSAVAALLWLIVSLLFSWYVGNFGNYDETYGSLGAVIGFMTWLWLSAAVALLGGELNAEMEHQTARDTTTGPERAMGARGARMADTVAPSE